MRFTSFVVASVVCVAISTARAEFVGGVEQFNGSSLDTNTWATYIYPGASITQNNALTITTQAGHPADYVARLVKVGVDGAVSADVTYLSGDSELGIALTNNTTNATDTFAFDTQRIQLELYGSNPRIVSITNNGPAGSSVLLQPDIVPSVSISPGTTFNFRIERVSAPSAKFDVRNSSNTLIGSQTIDLGQTIPAFTNVALYAYDRVGSFDNVTLSGNVQVPEPMGLPVIGLASLLLARRTKRTVIPSGTPRGISGTKQRLLPPEILRGVPLRMTML